MRLIGLGESSNVLTTPLAVCLEIRLDEITYVSIPGLISTYTIGLFFFFFFFFVFRFFVFLIFFNFLFLRCQTTLSAYSAFNLQHSTLIFLIYIRTHRCKLRPILITKLFTYIVVQCFGVFSMPCRFVSTCTDVCKDSVIFTLQI